MFKFIGKAIAADKAKKIDVDKRTSRALALIGIGMFCVIPELALAGPWDSMATQVLSILTGGLTRTIAIITVIACGIAAMAGKLPWDWAIKIVVGIVLIFGATSIVDYLISAAA
jgi:type IV secretory pathway VirB2 component (pilin)